MAKPGPKKGSHQKAPQSRDKMHQMKVEAASEVGVNLKQGYNGEMTSKEAGKIGGQMVKKMVEKYNKH